MDSLNDFEQKEMLKKWWNDYGKFLAIAVVIGLIFGYGWRYWNQRQIDKSAAASAVYQQLLAAEGRNDAAAAKSSAATILQQYPQTNYAALAALFQARDAVRLADYNTAYQNLQWIWTHGTWAVIKQIARIRAARILLQQGKVDEASSVLAVVEDKSFQPLIQQIQGDIYSKQNQHEKAQQAYHAAKNGLLEAGTINPILEMKLVQ